MGVFSAYRLQSLIGPDTYGLPKILNRAGLQRLSASVADRTCGIIFRQLLATGPRLQRLSASVADRTSTGHTMSVSCLPRSLQRLSASVADRTITAHLGLEFHQGRLQRLSASVADRTSSYCIHSLGVMDKSSAPIGFSR